MSEAVEKVQGAFIALQVCDFNESATPMWIRASTIDDIDSVADDKDHSQAKSFIRRGANESHWVTETPQEIMKLINRSMLMVHEDLAKRTAIHLKLSPIY